MNDIPKVTADIYRKAMSFSERMITARAEHEHTRDEAAVRIGISARTIAGWEDDKRIPSVTHYSAVARYLGMKIIHLYRLLDEEKNGPAT